VVGQLAEWFGLLGSAGGPESSSTPLGIVVLLTPSLFLGSAFLLLLVAVHQVARPERKVWSLAALAFGTVYTALISINYYVQLAWVAPRLAEGRTAGMEPFLFVPFDSFLGLAVRHRFDHSWYPAMARIPPSSSSSSRGRTVVGLHAQGFAAGGSLPGARLSTWSPHPPFLDDPLLPTQETPP